MDTHQHSRLLNVTRRAVGAVAFIIGASVATSSVTVADEATLAVPGYTQEKSNWCWVAAVKMIVKYKTGSTISQCSLYKDGKSTSTCPNQTGSKANVMNALASNGVNPGTVVDLTWAQTRAEIDGRRPIYSSIIRTSGTGHAHVIRGYYNSGYSYGVSYMDPATGTRKSAEWSFYKDNSWWNAGTAIIYLYAN